MEGNHVVELGMHFVGTPMLMIFRGCTENSFSVDNLRDWEREQLQGSLRNKIEKLLETILCCI